MRYFDTSFLAPLLREEKTSSRIGRFMAGLPTEELAISCWTEVEFASLLARDVRMGVIGSDQARAAGALFEDVIQQSFVVLLPSADDYEMARRYLHNYETGLRAGDALHLSERRDQRGLARRRRSLSPSQSRTGADFDGLESLVGWAKARSSRRAHAAKTVGTLRFAYAASI